MGEEGDEGDVRNQVWSGREKCFSQGLCIVCLVMNFHAITVKETGAAKQELAANLQERLAVVAPLLSSYGSFKAFDAKTISKAIQRVMLRLQRAGSAKAKAFYLLLGLLGISKNGKKNAPNRRLVDLEGFLSFWGNSGADQHFPDSFRPGTQHSLHHGKPTQRPKCVLLIHFIENFNRSGAPPVSKPSRFENFGNALDALQRKWEDSEAFQIPGGFATSIGNWSNTVELIFRDCRPNGPCSLSEALRAILSFEEDPLAILVVFTQPILSVVQLASILEEHLRCLGSKLDSKRLCHSGGSFSFRRHAAGQHTSGAAFMPHFSHLADYAD